MAWFANLSIRSKLSLGFGALLVALLASNLFGYRGIDTIHDSVLEIGERNAPVIDSANVLANSLLKGQTLIQEIDARTIVVAADTADHELTVLMSRLAHANEQFDQVAQQLLSGQSASSELAKLVKEADGLHNSAFQPLAGQLIDAGRSRLQAKAELDIAMGLMEGEYETAIELADGAETAVKVWVESATATAFDTESVLIILREISPFVDATMEMKVSLLEARVRVEEIVQQSAPDKVNALFREYQAANTHFDALITAVLEGGDIDGEQVAPLPAGAIREFIQQLDASHAVFQSASDSIVAKQRQLLELTASAESIRERLFQVESDVAAIVERIKGLSLSRMDQAKRHAEDQYSEAVSVLVIIVAVASLFGLVIGGLISRSVSIPLARAVQLAKQLAEGDLTARVKVTSTDETGQLLTALNQTSHKLMGMVTQIASSTEQLSSAATGVAAVTTQTASNIDCQTAQLEQTSVAMNEMSATVREVAQNATEAAEATQRSDRAAKEGRELVAEANSSVRTLATQIDETRATINRLSQETEKVGSILDAITGIAEQTNLLALNAAIEAARAGEQGRGFAVVADEVRSLASRTQESTSTIQSMIASLKAEAHRSVEAMNAGHAQAGEVVNLSERADKALTEIEHAVGVITQMNLQIASAAEEQSAVAEEVNVTVHRLNQTEAKTSNGAKQVAAATDELSQLAESLRSLVKQFRVA